MSPHATSLLAVITAVVAASATPIDEFHQQCSAVKLGQIWSRDIPVYLPPMFISNPDTYIVFPDHCLLNNMYLQGTEIVACNVEPYGPEPELISDDHFNPLSGVRVFCQPEFNRFNVNVNWCPMGVRASAVQYCSPFSSAYIGRDGSSEKDHSAKKEM